MFINSPYKSLIALLLFTGFVAPDVASAMNEKNTKKKNKDVYFEDGDSEKNVNIEGDEWVLLPEDGLLERVTEKWVTENTKNRNLLPVFTKNDVERIENNKKPLQSPSKGFFNLCRQDDN